MRSDKFTILELLDLALRVPEVGVVNFNILHSVLTFLVMELGLGDLKPECPMDESDELVSQKVLAKSRANDPHIRRRESFRSSRPPKAADVPRTRMAEPEDSSSAKGGALETTMEEPDRDSLETEIEDSKNAPQSREAGVSPEKESAKGTMDEAETSTPETIEDDHKATSQGELESQESDGSPPKEPIREAETSTLETIEDDHKTTPQEELESQESDGPPKEESVRGAADEAETSATETSKDDEKAAKLVISLPRLTADKDLEEVTVAEKAAEVKAVAEDILRKTSDAKSTTMEILSGSTEETMETVATNALKVLADENILQDTDPVEIIQEMWKVISINRRIGATEEGVKELTTVMDVVLQKVQELESDTGEMVTKTKNILDDLESYFKRIRILEETCVEMRTQIEYANEFTRTEVERLEETIERLRLNQEMHSNALEELKANLKEFMEQAAKKEELEELKKLLDSRAKELKKRILEVQDMIIPKEDFMELVSRVDAIEETKVGREELGRLLEPGFLENFISEHENLIKELEELKMEVMDQKNNFDALIKRIDEEILKSIEDSFAEVNGTIDAMKEKLDTLDADDINDTFARLEELFEEMSKDLDHIKATQSKFEKEVKTTFKKISDVTSVIERLEATKVDKSKMYELLELKADIEMLMTKLDKSEFVAVITDVQENLERLSTTVKINEEEMTEGFINVRHELSFKMYTEDFIIGTEPIRNRIKAILYEQKKIKELILTNLFPDAPGVTKCFSCKRAANLMGPKFQDSPVSKFVEETSSVAKSKPGLQKTVLKSSSKESSQLKLPPIDMDSVPIPPADKPRIKDIHQLPVLFAAARPQVGLAREKNRRDIDNEVAAYFTTGKFVAIGGEYTKTFPQQKGLSFKTIELPAGKKSEVLLQGLDKRFYKGALYDQDTPAEQAGPTVVGEEAESNLSHDISKNGVRSSVVVLKHNLPATQSTATLSVPKSRPRNVKSRIIPSRNHD